MGIISRFSDIVSSNINALLDKAEDPAKMIDEYLRQITEDLAEVKRETANVMAEETRTKRLVDDNQREIAKYEDLAKKALTAGNEDDARVFLTKKQETASVGASLQASYTAAHETAVRMRQMHDKLVGDINTLNNRRQAIKTKVAVAKTQERINKVGTSAEQLQDTMGAFERMEHKADQMLDSANAMADLNAPDQDPAAALEEKYTATGVNASVEDELAEMKKQMGI